MLGYFSVSIIHQTLTWTTGTLTCVWDLFACIYLGLYSHPKDFFFSSFFPCCCCWRRWWWSISQYTIWRFTTCDIEYDPPQHWTQCRWMLCFTCTISRGSACLRMWRLQLPCSLYSLESFHSSFFSFLLLLLSLDAHNHVDDYSGTYVKPNLPNLPTPSPPPAFLKITKLSCCCYVRSLYHI